MDNEAQILLDDIISFCPRDGLDTRLINMLGQSIPVSLDDESLTLQVPSRFASTYLLKQQETIERYLEEITFAPMALRVEVPAMPAPAQVQPPVPQASVQAAYSPAAAPAAQEANVSSKSVENRGFAAQASAFSDIPMPHRTNRDAEPTSVKVNNTMTPEMFQRMMSSMKQQETAPVASRETTPAEEPQQAKTIEPAVGINSKFTFDPFVPGVENRHAYQSALRFTASVEVPGECTSLFIYGKSGLGKTHLLFAIKNFLAVDKPEITVKYANSQTYIDDFINEVAKQKNDGHSILREYHEANVLIIDDIQNIIGKQASIDYFFSLMDEYIRENKKIVIASDRAPKDLGMDERLTSRFSSGMLCLISEPGFEMKYLILQNYCKRMASNTHELPAAGAPSIFSNLQMHEGHLTEDHLKHMAEVSGNNIRELESFCERCASLSYEKEQAGKELSAEDIDAVANEYFDTARKVIAPKTVQSVVEGYYNISHEDMIGRKRQKTIAFARHVAIYLVNDMCDVKSQAALGAVFGRDHATIVHSISVVEGKLREDANFGEELAQLKNKIILKS